MYTHYGRCRLEVYQMLVIVEEVWGQRRQTGVFRGSGNNRKLVVAV